MLGSKLPNSVEMSIPWQGGVDSLVNDTDFMDLWRSQTYQNLVKGWGNHPVCAQCNMKRPEGGDA